MTKNTNPTGASDPVRAVAMAWFRREDFARIKTMMIDADKLHSTWELWVKAAEANQQGFEARGFVVIRVVVVPEDFAAWCGKNGRDFDAKARMDYAVTVAGDQGGTLH